MFIQSKIFLNIVYLVISLHVVLPWLPPERCKQGDKTKRATIINSFAEFVPTVRNITEIALNQNINLNETYNNSKFFGVPISGYYDGCEWCNYLVYVPNRCTFYTYNPRLLSSVYCQEGVACKLGHTVSTTESYSASEGYNWGVKVSAKLSLWSVFDIGGEVSSGSSYSCTFTKSRTKTDNVECSISNGGGKTLQLYNVQSDMECQFSTVTMVPEGRNGKHGDWTLYGNFTNDDIKMTEDYAIVTSSFTFWPSQYYVLPNLDRMSDHLLEKMKNLFPDYNPYTDMVNLHHPEKEVKLLNVLYYKEGSSTPGIKKVIPFTNEDGDSIYEYACILT